MLPSFNIREFYFWMQFVRLTQEFLLSLILNLLNKGGYLMAKKDLTKIDLELEEAKKKVTSLENERKLAEENLQKQIGKIYVQIQLKKDKNQSYGSILDDLKTEFTIIKEEEKARREAAKKARENVGE